MVRRSSRRLDVCWREMDLDYPGAKRRYSVIVKVWEIVFRILSS
jgi:hypothetical protein